MPGDGLPDRCNSESLILHFRLNQDKASVPELDNAEILESPQQSEATLPEPRWPAIAAFVTAWLCPATSARCMRPR